MRKIVVMTMLLACSLWVSAQAGSNSQSSSTGSQAAQPGASNPSGSSSSSSSATTGSGAQSKDQSASPNSSASAGPSAGGTITEGCLGGTAPNFTLTDSAGKVYALSIPNPAANSGLLTQHLGESVAVMGTVSDAGSAASSASSGSSTGAASSAQPTIAVTKIGRGTTSCPSSKNQNSNQPQQKPPSQ